MGWRRRWSAECWPGRACLALAAGALVLFCAAAVVRATTAGDAQLNRLAGQTQVWSMALAGLGMSVRLTGRALGPPALTAQAIEQVRADLAKAVLRAESEQRARLLGTDRPDVRTVDVRFHPEFELVRFGAGANAPPGSLASVFAYFQSVPSRRMVVVGEPGSGKSVLAVELLVRFLEAQRDEPAKVAGDLAAVVPVRFNLSTWATDRQGFEAWLCAQLVDRYQLHPQAAASLVADRRVLPVLDGLDEMDPEDGMFRRATAALRMLNEQYLAGSDLAPVVLTCREARYATLCGRAGGVGGLDRARCVAIEPVRADQIREFLRRRLRTSAEEVAWAPVLDDLALRPHSPLARTLDTPWRLALAATVYGSGGNPADLLRVAGGPDAGARLTRLLLGRFTVAAVALHPRKTRGGALHPRPYTARQVTTWLRLLAGHLAVQGTLDRSALDLTPHELWRMIPRVARAAHTVFCAAVGFFLIFTTLGVLQSCSYDPARWPAAIADIADPTYRHRGGLASVLISYWVVPALASPVFWAGWDPRPGPHRLAPRGLRTRRGLLGLARHLGVWLCLGVSLGLIYGLITGPAVGSLVSRTNALSIILTFAMVGMIASLAVGLNTGTAAAATPYEPLRQDFRFALVCVLTMSVVGTLGDWCVNWVLNTAQTPSDIQPGFWLTSGLALWTTLGVGCGITVWSRARGRYALAVGVLAARSRLPLRLAAFLSWAHHAGLLRTSGTAYQYRHRQLQDWLTPQARLEPSAPSAKGARHPHAAARPVWRAYSAVTGFEVVRRMKIRSAGRRESSRPATPTLRK